MRAGIEVGTVVLSLDEVEQRRAWLAAVRASVEEELAVLDELRRVLAATPASTPAAATVASAGGPPSHTLSAREVTVVRLVAAGCSNREIGRRLHISANTAANHVRSILTKSGAANRAGAVRFAAEHRLLDETA